MCSKSCDCNYQFLICIHLGFYFHCFLLVSCGLKQKLNYSSEYIIPDKKFNDSKVRLPLNYSDEKIGRSDLINMTLIKYYQKITAQRTKKKLNVSVFFIHPTTLFSSKKWNADTYHFLNNNIIDLCLENQASVLLE